MDNKPSSSNESSLKEALRQWVELCFLTIEHRKNISSSNTATTSTHHLPINQEVQNE
jgi:hypothetical protein